MSALEGVDVEIFSFTPALRLHGIEGFETSIGEIHNRHTEADELGAARC